MPLSLGEAMLDRNSIPHRSSAGLVLPILALAAAGILLILIAGSLGATTSGRGFLSFWVGTPGQGRDTVTRTSDLPEHLVGSGA